MVNIDQPVDHVLPGRGRGRHRLPDEPVQHRRRRPVPARGRCWPRRSAARCTCPSILHVAVILLVAMVVGAAWAGIAGVLKVTPRRQRGHLDDHAELHRHRRDRVPADAGPAGRAGRRQQQHRHPADPGERPGPRHSPSSAPANGAGRRASSSSRSSSASAYWFLLEPHPVRLRPAGDRPIRAGRGRQRRQRQADDRRRACCISGAVAGLVGMPQLLGEVALVRHRLPDRPRLHRHRDRPARPQQPGRDRRSARCCGRSWTPRG